MKDRRILAKLRRRLLAEGLEISEGRVLLYRKVQSYDSAASVSLEVMLADFDLCEVFQSVKRKQPEFLDHLPPAVDEESFQTARFDLFAKVFEELRTRKPLRAGDSMTKHQANGGEWWRLTGDDDTGILFRVLQRLFQRGLNIDFLCAGSPMTPTERENVVVIDIIARPFYPSAQKEPTREALKDFESWKSGDGDGHKSMTITRLDPRRPLSKGMNDPRSLYLYKIETADVPGMALRITARIVRYYCAIEAYFLDTSHLVEPVGYGDGLASHFVAITPVDKSGRVTDHEWVEAKRVQFEVDLQQGLGIQRFKRITLPEFKDGIAEANKQRIGRKNP